MIDLLPNCLSKSPQVDRNIACPGTWLVLNCANNCGRSSRVRDTEMPAQFAFYLCDECVETYGEPAGVAKTPDDLFREKVVGAILDEYGHPLTEYEIVRELENPTSIISKLENEAQRRK